MDRITVAISTDPTRRGLDACLESILEQTEAERLDWQVFEWESGPNRTQILESSKSSRVLFLDSDCRLPDPEFISRLILLHTQYPQFAVLGGIYLNDESGSFSDHAYNRICNSWIQRGGYAYNLIGGCLFVDRSRLPEKFQAPPSDFWGGEDTLLMRAIWESGAKAMCFPELGVIHRPDNSLKKSVMRGLCQGWNRSRFQLETPNPTKTLIPPIKYWPWWAIHFSAIEVGSTLEKLGRQIGQSHNRDESSPINSTVQLNR